MTAIVLGLLMSITTAPAPGSTPGPGTAPGTASGQRYPDFTLSTIAGDKTISLSDLRGKKVLLINFASW